MILIWDQKEIALGPYIARLEANITECHNGHFLEQIYFNERD